MALNRTALELTVKTVGQQAIQALNKELGMTRAEAKRAIAEFAGFEKAKDTIEDFTEAVLSTENGIKRYVRVLEKQRGEVQFLGDDYKRLTAEILDYQNQVKRAQSAAVVTPMSAADLRTEQGLGQHIQDLQRQASTLDMASEAYVKLKAQIRDYQKVLKEASAEPAPAPEVLNPRSLAGMRQSIEDLKRLKDNVEAGSTQFYELGRQIEFAERNLQQYIQTGAKSRVINGVKPVTEEGIQAEMDYLRQVRAQLRLNSDEYNRYTKEIRAYQKQIQEAQNPKEYLANDTLGGVRANIQAQQQAVDRMSFSDPGFEAAKRQLEEYNDLLRERTKLRLQPATAEELKTEQGIRKQIEYLEQERKELNFLEKEWQDITREVDRLNKQLNDAKAAALKVAPPENSERAYREKIEALRRERLEVDVNTKAYRDLSKAIGQAESQLQRAQSGQGTFGAQVRGRLLGAAGAVGATGLFGGGLVSALGAGAGFLAGGQAGAFALAGAVQGLQQGGGGMADVAAQVSRLNKVLESEAPKAYAENLAFINEVSIATGQTIPDATRNFLKLNAAVKAAGGDAETARGIYEAISGSIVKFGGSADDVAGAVNAVTQVFSKGKVSAEELSGQIGERLVGAYVKFAQANGYTTKELSKFLEEGEVTLDQFIKFTRYLQTDAKKALDDYRTSTEAAGARFNNAFSNFQAVVGKILMPLGAALQDLGTNFLNTSARIIVGLAKIGEKIQQFLIPAFNAFKEVVKVAAVALLQFGAIQVGIAIGNGLFAAGQAMITFIKLVRTGTLALRAFALSQAAVAALSGAMAKGGRAGAFGLAGVLAAAVALKDQLGPLIGGLGDIMNKAFNDVFPEVTPKVDDLKNEIGKLDPALSGLNDTGKETKRTFEDIAKSLMGLRTDVAIQKLENEKASLDKLGQAWADFAIAQLKAKESFEQVRGMKGVTGDEVAAAAKRQQLQIDAARIQLKEALKGIDEANNKAIESSRQRAKTWEELLSEPGYSNSETVQQIAKERRARLSQAFDELIRNDEETLKELIERGGASEAVAALRKQIAQRRAARSSGFLDQMANQFASQQAVGPQIAAYVQQLSQLKIESENAADGINQLTTAQEALLFLM